MKTMFKMMTGGTKDPVDEVWLHHAASGTVIGGENLGWMYPADVLAQQPMMLKSMVKPDEIYIFTDPRKVANADTVASCWKQILAWPATTVMTYHDVPGHAAHDNARAGLKRAVENAKQV